MNRRQKRVFTASMKHIQVSREEQIKFCETAEEKYLLHLRGQGVDTSVFPVLDVFVPQFGVTRPTVCLPNEMKPAFEKWMREEYLPGLGLRRRRND